MDMGLTIKQMLEVRKTKGGPNSAAGSKMPNFADVLCERPHAARRWALTPSAFCPFVQGPSRDIQGISKECFPGCENNG